MAPSESQRRASLKWDKENMATVGCKIKRIQAEQFKQYCKEHGKTSNTMLREYILSCIGEDNTPGGLEGQGGSLPHPSE